jgi:hypothetical protein
MWKTLGVFHRSCGKLGGKCGKLGGKCVEIPLYVEIVENFSPKTVENFIIVENYVENVEKFSTGLVESLWIVEKFIWLWKTCGKLLCGDAKSAVMRISFSVERCSVLNDVQC